MPSRSLATWERSRPMDPRELVAIDLDYVGAATVGISAKR